MPEVVERISHEDWLAEAVRRFGPNPLNWRFVCPFCGRETSCQEFVDVGVAINDAHRAATECIGRVVGARGGMKEGRETNPDGTPAQPCDWAAFGLFGNLGKGPIVVRVIDGAEQETQAFAFAEVPDGR